ncbi:MAG: K(+)/H(+) antiporter NhaP2 [bacterium ADurb.Bin429]|nr:MAG: K(+)/H(+) antiporter NhaP2 [bacterium ADurb.Bin429]
MDPALLGLTSIIIFGITAQWLSWKLKLPAILLLLLFGILAGPVLGVLEPDRLFGNALPHIVALSVAVILYEGGLSLRFHELKQVGSAVIRLISIGALVTWLVGAAGAYYLLGFDLQLAFLFGAILSVTGPTVIGPLMRQVRPVGPVGPVLKWEGILIDPIGAMLTVLVLYVIITHGGQPTVIAVVLGVVQMIGIGVGIGALGAWVLLMLLKHYLVPDYLQNPVSLTILFGVYAAAHYLQPESGLFAATMMGIVLANQRTVPVEHIVEFKENLRVLLISTLFIVLAARLQVSDLQALSLGSVAFIIVLIFLARPLSVVASTIGTRLNWRERTFLSFIAPRGIVAAAIVTVAAERLDGLGFTGADRLVSIAFLVITATVMFYGIAALPLARWLKVASTSRQGFLIVGAHSWARAIALVLKQMGVRALLVDTNADNVHAARSDGLDAIEANILSDGITTSLSLDGIGRLLALTSNDEVNMLAVQRFIPLFGRAEVYQLAPVPRRLSPELGIAHCLQGRILCGEHCSFSDLQALHEQGHMVKSVTIGLDWDDATIATAAAGLRRPLFARVETADITVVTSQTTFTPKPGMTLVGFFTPDEELGKR